MVSGDIPKGTKVVIFISRLPADLQMESTGFPVSWNLTDHHELESSEIIENGAGLPTQVRSIAGAATLPWKWEWRELICTDLHCWSMFTSDMHMICSYWTYKDNGPVWLEESYIVTWYQVIWDIFKVASLAIRDIDPQVKWDLGSWFP